MKGDNMNQIRPEQEPISKVTIVLEELASGQVLITCECKPDIVPDNLTAPQKIATAIVAFVNDMMGAEEEAPEASEADEQPN